MNDDVDIFPREEACNTPLDVETARGACMLCGYNLVRAVETGYLLVQLAPDAKPAKMGEGDLVICTGCTSLLVMAEDGYLAIPTRRSFRELDEAMRHHLLAICAQVESAPIPAEHGAPGRRYIVSRGDHCVAGIRMRTGQLMTSGPCDTTEQAADLLKGALVSTLALEYKNAAPGMWFARGKISLFPGRELLLGIWGPEPTKAAARETAKREAIAKSTELGFETCGFVDGDAQAN